jgi:hypothetical protein
MNKKTKLMKWILLFILCTPSSLIYSQVVSNEEQLHDKYWSYRERFRK